MPSLPLGGAGSTGPGAFSPATITGLTAWHKADALALSDGTAVSSWTDSSGNGFHATQATGANQPLYKVNIFGTKPALLFDGVSDFLDVTGISADASRTVFVVLKATAATADAVALSGHTTNVRAVTVLGSGGWYYFANQAAGTVTISTTAATTAAVITIKGTSTASVDLYYGTGAAVNFDPNDDWGAITAYKFGARADNANFFPGYIAEVIVYDSALSDTDRAAVRDYLRTKYGL